jgi:hypothetical protein
MRSRCGSRPLVSTAPPAPGQGDPKVLGPPLLLVSSCFPHSRHSRYQPPWGLRRRCQRRIRSLQRQGFAMTASLGMSRSGSLRATRRVQTRESTPLAWCSCSEGVIPYSSARNSWRATSASRRSRWAARRIVVLAAPSCQGWEGEGATCELDHHAPADPRRRRRGWSQDRGPYVARQAGGATTRPAMEGHGRRIASWKTAVLLPAGPPAGGPGCAGS